MFANTRASARACRRVPPRRRVSTAKNEPFSTASAAFVKSATSAEEVKFLIAKPPLVEDTHSRASLAAAPDRKACEDNPPRPSRCTGRCLPSRRAAETMMIGIACNSGSAFMCRRTSYPSTPGIMMSHNTRSNRCFANASMACLPSAASTVAVSLLVQPAAEHDAIRVVVLGNEDRLRVDDADLLLGSSALFLPPCSTPVTSAGIRFVSVTRRMSISSSSFYFYLCGTR